MKLLRGLASRHYSCGCRIGIYETRDGSLAEIVDLRAPSCRRDEHRPGTVMREGAAYALPDSGPWIDEVAGAYHRRSSAA